MSRSFTDSVNPIVIPTDFTIRHRPPSDPKEEGKGKIKNKLTDREIRFILSDIELVQKCLSIFARCHKDVKNIYESNEDLHNMGYEYLLNFLHKYFSKSKFKNPKCKVELKQKVVKGFQASSIQQATRTMSEFTNHKNNNKSKSGIAEIKFDTHQAKVRNSLDQMNLSVSEIFAKTDTLVIEYLEEFHTNNLSEHALANRFQRKLDEIENPPFANVEEMIDEADRVESALRTLAGRTKKVA